MLPCYVTMLSAMGKIYICVSVMEEPRTGRRSPEVGDPRRYSAKVESWMRDRSHLNQHYQNSMSDEVSTDGK